MLPVFSLLLVLVLSFLIIRIATVALVQTGVTTQVARFQARSAFTGVGFTTTESEQIVTHPVRRRIVMLLMLLGNAGFVTAVAALLLTFIGDRATGWPTRLGLLMAGVAILWGVASSATVELALARLIDRALERWTGVDARDYASLLRVSADYAILELKVDRGDWLAGHTLQELSLRDEGVLVLGVSRANGSYVGAPRGHTVIEPGDVLLVYGREAAVRRLDQRQTGLTGDQAHDHAVAEQRRILHEERKQQDFRNIERRAQ